MSTEKTTLTKAEIARGYDQIVEKVGLEDRFYDDCIAMHPSCSGSVLDIGCGRGLLLQKLKQKHGASITITGIDISERLCEISRENNPGAVIVQGDAEALPFPDNSFDTVFMTEVLEHLLDYPKALSEVHRVLRPSGVFVVSVPNRDWASYDFYDKIRNHALQPVDDHYFRFTEITQLLRDVPFKIEAYRGLDNLFYYGWKHKIELCAAFFLPILHRKMKRLLFRCTKGQ